VHRAGAGRGAISFAVRIAIASAVADRNAIAFASVP